MTTHLRMRLALLPHELLLDRSQLLQVVDLDSAGDGTLFNVSEILASVDLARLGLAYQLAEIDFDLLVNLLPKFGCGGLGPR